ncbi:MAG: hypothetical protein MHMPM18_001399 [Marteilia pararefringens]
MREIVVDLETLPDSWSDLSEITGSKSECVIENLNFLRKLFLGNFSTLVLKIIERSRKQYVEDVTVKISKLSNYCRKDKGMKSRRYKSWKVSEIDFLDDLKFYSIDKEDLDVKYNDIYDPQDQLLKEIQFEGDEGKGEPEINVDQIGGVCDIFYVRNASE